MRVDDSIDRSAAETLAVTTMFAINGTITKALNSKSNGVDYQLVSASGLTEADLVVGRKIKFNYEKSAADSMGKITKTWIET